MEMRRRKRQACKASLALLRLPDAAEIFLLCPAMFRLLPFPIWENAQVTKRRRSSAAGLAAGRRA
ncbi:hypothetical protein ACLOJK_020689 [Asimina triloba]